MSDMRLAVRGLVRSPGFALTAIAALAVSIGANTAIFSAINAALLNPPGIRDPQSLAILRSRYVQMGAPNLPVAAPDIVDVRAAKDVFASAALVLSEPFSDTGGTWPERLTGARVSAGFLQVLGATPAIGRDFRPEEDQPGQGAVVLLSHELWMRRFGGDPAAVGKILELDRQPHRIAGVLPREFRWPGKADFWIPLALPPERYGPKFRHKLSYIAVARLQPGVSQAQASAALDLASRRILDREDDTGDARRAGWSLYALPFSTVTEQFRKAIGLLMGAVGCILLIACANIAGLMLARNADRARELALRAALGARRWELIRPVLAETLCIALVGVVLGIALAWGLRPLLVQAAPDDTLSRVPVPLDYRVLAFSILSGAAAALLFGLAPALESSRLDRFETLREGGRSGIGGRLRVRMRAGLIAAQVAMAVVLLTGAGLLLRSLWRVEQVNPGFDPQRLVTAAIAAPAQRYDTPDKKRAFHAALHARLGELAGNSGAALASQLPFASENWWGGLQVEGRQDARGSQALLHADFRSVTPGYFETMRIPVLRGRSMEAADRTGAIPSAWVDETLVRTYFPGEDPIGRRISRGPGLPKFAIAGVVGRVAHQLETAGSRPTVYFVMDQAPPPALFAVLRTPLPPASAATAMREAMRAVDPAVPLDQVRSMEERLEASLGGRRFVLGLLGVFAAVALLLSALGLYGLIRYSVAQRAQEIGVRMALGAQVGQVVRMVLGQGLRLAGIGLGIGLIGAAILARVLQSQLYQVSPVDPVALCCTAAILLAVVLAASYLPARRAARIDPIRALRAE